MKCWPLLPPSTLRLLLPSRASSLATPIVPSPHSSPRGPQSAGNPPSVASSKSTHSAKLDAAQLVPPPPVLVDVPVAVVDVVGVPFAVVDVDGPGPFPVVALAEPPPP